MSYIWLGLMVYFGMHDNLVAILILNISTVVLFLPWQYFKMYVGYIYQILDLTFASLSGDDDKMRKQALLFESYMVYAYAFKDANGCLSIELEEELECQEEKLNAKTYRISKFVP